MRTDTQRLDWILGIVESQDDEAAERLTAAYTLELRGRPMLDAAMGAKVVEPGEPMPALTAIDLATAELGRIRNVKGFSEERDDLYTSGELGDAAVTYLQDDSDRGDHGGGPEYWPWDYSSWKPSPDDRKKELTKGIALALCELDRLLRAERRELEAHEAAGKAFASGTYRVVDGGLQAQPREFKVGDRVLIARKVTEQPGWNNSWVSPEMDRAIGGAGVIEHISDYGVEVLGIQYKWPSSSLEHVDD